MPELNIRLVSGDKLDKLQSRITGISSSISQEVVDVMNEPGEYRIMAALFIIYTMLLGAPFIALLILRERMFGI